MKRYSKCYCKAERLNFCTVHLVVANDLLHVLTLPLYCAGLTVSVEGTPNALTVRQFFRYC